MQKILENQIRNLALITGEKYFELQNIGILSGRAGIALFQFYCEKYSDENSYHEKGIEILNSCVESINTGYSFPTYCSGVAEFGWLMQHLVDNNLIESDLDELLYPFNDFLKARMNHKLSESYHDFLHGGLGYGFFFLKRFEGTNRKVLKEKYFERIESLLILITGLAISEGNKKKWKPFLDTRTGVEGYNLSLFNGRSSIAYFLTKISRIDSFKAKSEGLAIEALNFIWQYKNTTGPGISFFPNRIEQDSQHEYPSRLAWCYGDIGIGLATTLAGNSFDRKELITKGVDFLIHSSSRRTIETTSVVDAGFCHGSFGKFLYMIFTQNFQKKNTDRR